MSRRSDIALTLIACGGLLAGASCTRTPDGSVVMARPSMPSLFASRTNREAYGPDQRSVALAELPPAQPAAAPSQPRKRVVPPIGAWKVQTVKAPFERADPQKPLNCRNETSAQGRVRVVCQ